MQERKERAMRKLLYATAALALVTATAAHADERARRDVGAVTGAATGAATGAVLGGPIGAAAGGVVGAAIGAAAAIPPDARTYVVEHPVESVDINGDLSDGYVMPENVVIYKIPRQSRFGYVYVDGRPVIVRLHSRKVVYVGSVYHRDDNARVETRHVGRYRAVQDDDDSAVDGQPAYDEPAYDGDDTTGAIPDDEAPAGVITYVERHRVAPVDMEGDVEEGYVVPRSVELVPVPDDPEYGYIYLDSGPVLVRRDTRRVIWVH
jgi:hypothetical protein